MMDHSPTVAVIAVMERRILLAFALNRLRTMTCAEAITAAAVARRPVDEAPAFEKAVEGLCAKGTLTMQLVTVAGWKVPTLRVADFGAMPVQTAAALRSRMGVCRPEDDGRFTRLLVLPTDQLAEAAQCYVPL